VTIPKHHTEQKTGDLRFCPVRHPSVLCFR
jgi:hypothetical protein